MIPSPTLFAKCAKRTGHPAVYRSGEPLRHPKSSSTSWFAATCYVDALPRNPVHGENSLTPSRHGEVCRGPFGFAQGRLFDSAWTSLREVHAALRMTMVGWLLWEPRRDKARCPCLLPVLVVRRWFSSLRRDCQRKNERPRLARWSHYRAPRIDVAVM